METIDGVVQTAVAGHGGITSTLNQVNLSNATMDRASFNDLPPEIQNIIWKYALPKSRILRVGVTTSLGYSSPVPTILHICRRSRAYALSQLSLGFNTQTECDFYWIPSIDMVLYDLKHLRVQNSEAPNHGLLHRILRVGDLQHLGLYATRMLLPGNRIWDVLIHLVFSALPSLKSLSFVRPISESTPRDNTVSVLYEATDVKVSKLGLTPSEFLDQIRAGLEEHQARIHSKEDLPLLEFFVVGTKKPKPSSLCIQPRDLNVES